MTTKIHPAVAALASERQLDPVELQQLIDRAREGGWGWASVHEIVAAFRELGAHLDRGKLTGAEFTELCDRLGRPA